MKKSAQTDKLNQIAFLKILSNLFESLTAGWFALILITPNFINLSFLEITLFLLKNIFLGMVFMIISYFLEIKLLNYEH